MVDAERPLRRCERSKRLALAVLSLVVSILMVAAMGEIVLRLRGWRAPGFYIGDDGPLGHRYVDGHGGPHPPGSGRLVGPSFDVAWSVNRHGFREREPIAKGLNEHRIGLLGDSMLAGFGVSLESRFAEPWTLDLIEREPSVTVWNLGASGAGTAHLAEVVAGVGRDYELDELVLVLFAGNELEDNLEWEWRHDARPGGDPSEPRWSGLRTALRDHSRVALYLWLRGVHGLATRLEEPPSPAFDVAEQWPATERALERFRLAAGDRRWQLWLLPAREDWDDEHWKAVRARRRPVHAERHGLTRRVRGWSLEHGVPFVDATPFLRGADPTVVKFPTDGHWTSSGHERVASGLLKQEVSDLE